MNGIARPDLSYLTAATQIVGRSMSAGATVVFESTVYPGCTEEVCIPILERESGLKAGLGFKVGYSPERINPGDQSHTIEKVVKVVAGQDPETTEIMAKVYGLAAEVGVFKAPNIRTAEAAKVIENIQRDLNIALVNEIAMVCHRLGLDTHEVLESASTKWNFLDFRPGLVGGHCIPVDSYYLTHKAQEVGYHPEVILAGRRINDSMGPYIARETVKLLIKAGKVISGANVLVMGVAFKEDVHDARNTGVVGLVRELENHEIEVAVYDPLVDSAELARMGLNTVSDPFEFKRTYDGLVLAVPHAIFRARPVCDYVRLLEGQGGQGVLTDVKGVLRGANVNGSVLYWSL